MSTGPAAAAVFEIRILGPLEVTDGVRQLSLRGTTQRAVLAVLVLNRNRVVPWDRIVDELWGNDPPETARKMIHNAVSQLRKLLLEAGGVPEENLVTRGGGYLLRLEPGQVDSDRFERLVEEGREARERRAPAVAASKLQEALDLWRGPALSELVHEPFARAEAARLEELRLAALEEWLEAELALGHHTEIVGELEALVAEYPLRERFRAQLMLALYRSGRQAEALDVYQATRRLLVDDLGIEPGPELQRLERAVLVHDPSLEPPEPTAAPAEVAAPARPAREARKTVSVLFADLVSLGPRLDPEAHRRLTTRALDAASGAVERHGGLVERMPTGELMAVFGVPLVHEDDALRAVRAAVEMREALEALTDELERGWGARIALRAAVDTGEVVVGDAQLGHPIVAGDAVDVAARLREAAEPGELLIGDGTRHLVEPFVLAEPAQPNKIGWPAAWRLLDVRDASSPDARAREAPLVGREGELAQLSQAFERAVHERTSYLFTVLGPAGIGKSRLGLELASRLSDEATVLGGRCPSYGEGATFRPIAEIVRQAAGETTREAVASLLPPGPESGAIADRIAEAIGVAEGTATREELFWAARKLLEALARERPLVAVLDDLQWAEPTLLDLVEHVTDWAREAPIVLVCLARPELIETRPAWAGGKLNATTILLEPLSETETETLMAHLGGADLAPELRGRIAGAAEGNPLFLEQMLAVVGETPPGAEPAVPPTIQALLGARLDRLAPEERAVLERASVAGREFSRGAVVDLADPSERDAVEASLDRLTQKDLVRPTASTLAGDDVFRFRHSLICETTYESLPKESRADLHARFAAWLEQAVADRIREHEATIGYHLERAYRYHAELGPVTDAVRLLARRAAGLLASAGRRAHGRGDMPAAVSLLSRAETLLERGSAEQLEVLLDLGEALRETGEFERADAVLAGVADARGAPRGLAARAAVIRLRIRIQTDPDVSTEELVRDVRGAVDVFEKLGDHRGLSSAWEVLAWVPWFRCRAAEAEVALRNAIAHARRAGESRTEAQSLNLLVGASFFGPTPVPDAIRLCDDVLRDYADQPRVAASAMRALAGLKAMEGAFDEARAFVARHKAIVEDLGLRINAGWAAETYGIVELLAGDPAAAEDELRAGSEVLEELGDTGSATLGALIAQAVCAQGRYEEALHLSDVSERAATQEALFSEFQRRTVRARILTALGHAAEAELVGREAVALAEETDFLVGRGEALAALAEAVRLAGRADEAASLLERALELYEEKGCSVCAAHARATLAELRRDERRAGLPG